MNRPAVCSALPALAAVVVLAGVRTAAADCPPSDVVCVLQKEGTDALVAKDFSTARTKFDASIATQPSARAYLGRAQAVAGLDDPAGAYEAILEAKRLSDAEVAATPRDASLKARSERIKYLMGDYRAKVGLLHLRVPEAIPASRIVSVQRKGEGNIDDPLNRAIPVAPDEQLMTAYLDDGSKLEWTVEIQAGGEATVVVPIKAKPVATASSDGAKAKKKRAPRVDGEVHRTDRNWHPGQHTIDLRLDAAVVPSEDVNGGLGLGAFGAVEKRLGMSFSIGGRLGIVQHVGASDPISGENISAIEVVALVGGRAYVTPHVYLGGDIGYLGIRETIHSMFQPDRVEGGDLFSLVLGIGASYGRIDVGAAALFAWDQSNVGSAPRLLATFGVKLFP